LPGLRVPGVVPGGGDMTDTTEDRTAPCSWCERRDAEQGKDRCDECMQRGSEDAVPHVDPTPRQPWMKWD